MITKAEPLWDLVEESLDESAFLWKRWEAELTSLTRSLDDVWSWSEDRLQGAFDGVRVSGAQIMRTLEPALAGDDLQRVSVAAHLLAARSPPQARNILASAVGAATGARLSAMVRGIEVADLDSSFAPVTTVLSNGDPERAAALCRLKAFRRASPARELSVAFESKAPELQAAALRAARYAPDETFIRYAASGLKSDSPAVRRAALESGIYRRWPSAWDLALQLTRERSPDSGPMLPLLAALGSADEQQLVIASLRVPALQTQGLFALGYIGTPEAAEICLAGMRDAKLARMAGEAYCAITGAALERDGLAAPEPAEGASPPPLESDSLDADLVPAAHDLWPLPNADAVRAHWANIRSGYASGVRHLGGKPISPNVLAEAIETGSMLRRPGLILETTIRTAGRYDVEPRAFAQVQRRMMAGSRAAILQSAAR